MNAAQLSLLEYTKAVEPCEVTFPQLFRAPNTQPCDKYSYSLLQSG